MFNGVMHPLYAKRFKGLLLILLPVNGTLDLRNPQSGTVCGHLSLPPRANDLSLVNIT